MSSKGESARGLEAGLLSRDDEEVSEETVNRLRPGSLSGSERRGKLGCGYNTTNSAG